jgi:hypothetical protein
MTTRTITVDTNVDDIAGGAWVTGDNLVINNGATVTVNTNQTKSWGTNGSTTAPITINNGKLLIQNTSTTTPVRFTVKQIAGTLSNRTIQLTNGLATFEVQGNWIDVGTSDGTSGQQMTLPYADYTAAVFVETASGSNEFVPWINLAQTHDAAWYGQYPDLTGVPADDRGRFFVQMATPAISATQTGSNTVLFTTTITFGNGINGKIIPTGAKVRVPNVVITDESSRTTFQDGTSTRNASFLMSGGGKLIADKCNFSYSYIAGGQAQTISLTNCCLGMHPDITECYDLNIDNVAITAGIRWPYYSSGWLTQDVGVMTPNLKTWQQITGAYINKLYTCCRVISGLGNTNTSPLGHLTINYADGSTISNCCFYMLQRQKGFSFALRLQYTSNATLSNNSFFGAGLCFTACSNNAVTGTRWSSNIGNYGNFSNGVSSSLIYITHDPSTGDRLVNGTQYYIKTVHKRASHELGWDEFQHGYQIGRTYSATPYSGDTNHPYWFGATPNNNQVVLRWPRREPAATSGTRYEIYRSTTYGVSGTIPTGGTITTLQGAAISNTDVYMELLNDTTASNGTTYYYTLRKYDSAGVYTDSAQQEATPTATNSITNLCLQSADFSNASWTKNSVTVTTNAARGPLGNAWSSTTHDADTLTPTSADSSVTQAFTTTAGNTYTFSIYMWVSGSGATTTNPQFDINIRCEDNGSSPQTVTQSCTLTRAIKRYSCTITTSSGSTTTTVRIGGASSFSTGKVIRVGDPQFVLGSSAGPLAGQTSTTSLTATETELSNNTTAGSTANHGGISAVSFNGGRQIKCQIAANPSNTGSTAYTELHVSTDKNFIPSFRTMVWNNFTQTATAEAGAYALRLDTGSNNNTVTTWTQYGFGGMTEFPLFISASASNRFIGFTLNVAGGSRGVLAIDTSTTSNNTFLHNFDFDNLPIYPRVVNATFLPYSTANNSGEVILQNIRSNTGGIWPLSTQWLNVIKKGVFGGFLLPLMNTTSVLIDPTSNNTITVDNNYTTVYDNIFYELYETETTGNLLLLMNASSKDDKPYTLSTTNPPIFQNDGTILFPVAGSYIEWEWPHLIKGVSGFRSANTGLTTGTTVYLGGAPVAGPLGDTTSNDSIKRLGCIKIEYALDTGSGYGSYKILNSTNLLAETVSASTGFRIKIKMTAMQTIPFTGQSTAFVQGETINGQTSSATAVVDEIVDNGTTGHLWVSSVTGTWAASENIRSGATVRATTVASPNQILPIQNQAANNTRVASLAIFTTVAPSATYAVSQGELTLTDLPIGTEVRIYDESDMSELGGIESTSGTTFTLNYDYTGVTINATIVVFALGYQAFRLTGYELDGSIVSIPISLVIDRQYNNPA